MPEVLSQSQIDELLNGLTSGKIDMDEVETSTNKKVKDYDFRTPKKFTKEQLKTVESIHESFARLFSSYLTSILRIYCQVGVTTTEEQRYHEFNNALPDSVLVGVIDLSFPDDNIPESQILIEVSRPISFAFIDRQLGGSGDGVDYEREYTEIEFSLLENLFRQFVPLIKDAWSNHYDVKASYNHLETNSRLMQSIRPDEIVVIIMMDISIKALKGAISVCIPAIALENLFKKAVSKYAKLGKRQDSMNDEFRHELILNYLKNSTLEISASLAEVDIPLKDILRIQVGDVIALDKNINEEISVKVGKSTWFKGKAGISKNKNAVRITTVL